MMNSRITRLSFRTNYRFFLLLSLLAGLVVLTAGQSARASTLPDGFTESLVVDGLNRPTAMAFAPDGRLFVLQQGGQVRIVAGGELLETPFLSINVNSLGERGLLGIAFDPDFANNGFVYLYYTTAGATTRNRISRFTADGNVAAPGSESIILNLNPLSDANNHNGGALHFAPDGKLYVAVGDNANSANSQTLDNLLGKMLRLNRDGTIPADNPFYDDAAGVNRAIWTLGLRNPFTFAVQPGTGRIFINDVGQQTWEEINDGVAGANYGWPGCEGDCNDPDYRDPVHTYMHTASVCAITGGTFYNPATNQFPAAYVGDYFFADYCAGWIRQFDTTTQGVTDFAVGVDKPVDLDVAPDGSLYYLDRGSDSIYRIAYVVDQPPIIHQHPQSQTITEGQPVTFTVQASGSAPLSYQWQRDGNDISGANSAAYTLPSVTPADDGAQFRVIVSNALGDDTSDEATLTVVENQPPVATITKPAPDVLYSGGDKIRYAGTAVDPEDGPLPASAFTWRVDFHHDTHDHPFIPNRSGKKGGSFTIPRTGETAANVWYRIHLTVRDSDGVEHSTFQDVFPQTVMVTLATNPAGLQVTLNGQPQTTPYTFESVVGIRHTLSAPTPQTLGGDTFRFKSWSNGKPRTHQLVAPAGDQTVTARFVQQ